jgi:hypothetical protein
MKWLQLSLSPSKAESFELLRLRLSVGKKLRLVCDGREGGGEEATDRESGPSPRGVEVRRGCLGPGRYPIGYRDRRAARDVGRGASVGLARRSCVGSLGYRVIGV